MEIALYITFCLCLVGILHAYAYMKRPIVRVSYKQKYENLVEIVKDYQLKDFDQRKKINEMTKNIKKHGFIV